MAMSDKLKDVLSRDIPLGAPVEVRKVANGWMIWPGFDASRAPHQQVTAENSYVFNEWGDLSRWLEEHFGVNDVKDSDFETNDLGELVVRDQPEVG